MGEKPHPAYQALVRALEASAAEKPGTPQSDENHQRADAIRAIAATMKFFREIGMERRLYAPLLDLLGALIDADEGRANPILTPLKKSTGTPKKLVRERYDWAAAAAAVTILKDDAKRRLGDAVYEVSRSTGIDAKELGEFRKNILRERANSEVTENYWYFLRHARSLSYPPEEQARRALKVVTEMRNDKKA